MKDENPKKPIEDVQDGEKLLVSFFANLSTYDDLNKGVVATLQELFSNGKLAKDTILQKLKENRQEGG